MVERGARVPAGEAIVQVLRAYGVEYIFSSPGSEWPPVWDTLARLKAEGIATPRYLNSRHEDLAVGMAVGYGRATGKLSAVLLHTGVGTLHGAMAIRSALNEEAAMVVAAGDTSTFGEEPGRDPGAQWPRYLMDAAGPARQAEPYVKWSGTVSTLAALPGMVEHACRLAAASPQGPAFLSVPMESMLGDVRQPLVPITGMPAARVVADPQDLDRASEILLGSRSPLIITEYSGRDLATVPTLVELAELLAIPVVESQAPAYLNFPHDHPLHAGFDAHPMLGDADVVLLVGAKGPWHPASRGPSREATVIMVDETPAKTSLPYWGYRVDLCLAGSLQHSLKELVKRLEAAGPAAPRTREEREARLARWREAHRKQREGWIREAESASQRSPIDPRWACHALAASLPQDAIVVEETTTQKLFLTQSINRNQPGTLYSRLTGGLGLGLCTALGVKVAQPDRTVVCPMGDGAFNYNPVLPALGFMQEYGVPILMVVLDNQGYTAMKSGLVRFFPEGWAVKTGVYYGSEITPGPDYSALAAPFGGYGQRVTDPTEIGPAMERALREVRNGRFALLDVVLDPGDQRQR